MSRQCSMSSLSDKSGFTLIELIVVVVISGILAVTAMPKFISLKSDAHNAMLEGTVGAVKSAVSLVEAKTLSSGDGLNVDDWAYRIYVENGSYAVAAAPRTILDNAQPNVNEVLASNRYFNYHWKVSGEPTMLTLIVNTSD